MLELTPEGRAALRDPSPLDSLIAPVPEPPRTRDSRDPGEENVEVDQDLFETLRAWRLEQAHAQEVPAFVVFHDSHLRAIAAHRPVTLEALSELKGIGPRKLEQYGAAVIGLVRKHLEGGTG